MKAAASTVVRGLSARTPGADWAAAEVGDHLWQKGVRCPGLDVEAVLAQFLPVPYADEFFVDGDPDPGARCGVSPG